MLKIAEAYFSKQGIQRADLEAESLTTALQGLLLTPDYFCAHTLKVCDSPIYETMSLQDDIAAILADKPADADFHIDSLYAEIASATESRETITFVQFADTHMDFKYKEGTDAVCDAGYCCREESDKGTSTIKAGKFGSLHQRCDVPAVTVEAVLDRVVSHDPLHIFWTGDNTAHDDAFVSQDEVNAELQAVVDLVAEKLGDRDLTVSIGNHDAFPNG